MPRKNARSPKHASGRAEMAVESTNVKDGPTTPFMVAVLDTHIPIPGISKSVARRLQVLVALASNQDWPACFVKMASKVSLQRVVSCTCGWLTCGPSCAVQGFLPLTQEDIINLVAAVVYERQDNPKERFERSTQALYDALNVMTCCHDLGSQTSATLTVNPKVWLHLRTVGYGAS